MNLLRFLLVTTQIESKIVRGKPNMLNLDTHLSLKYYNVTLIIYKYTVFNGIVKIGFLPFFLISSKRVIIIIY